jgi:hypothetical protein
VIVGNNPQFRGGNRDVDHAEVALQVALELVSPRGREVGTAT